MQKVFFALLIIFTSCNYSEPSIKIDEDTKAILNKAIDKTIGTDSSWRYYLKLPPPVLFKLPDDDKVDSLENAKFLNWRDSIKTILDTAEFFIVINQTIDTLSNSDIDEINRIHGSNKNKLNGDTTFDEVLRELCNNRNTFDSLPMEIFHSQYSYKFYSDKSFPNDRLRKIGSISFSKVAFNKSQDKAVVFTSFLCGGLCGSGQILFFEKKNNSWNYIQRWDMWVS